MVHLQPGFSLVELSIVLVILGLLVGFLLSGQSLIRAAELRSVVTDFNRYKTAMVSFRDKYFALPGDMPNATAFWGKNNAICPLSVGPAATPGTCEGDGSGLVEGGMEMFTFWQHLALAGMIEGSYSGPTASTSVAGVSVPRSRINNAYYSFPYDFIQGAQLFFGSNDPTWSITLATDGENINGNPCLGCGGALTNQEAWNIDTKIDDGVAATGKVAANVTYSDRTEVNGTCDTYVLSNTTDMCAVGYKLFR